MQEDVDRARADLEMTEVGIARTKAVIARKLICDQFSLGRDRGR